MRGGEGLRERGGGREGGRGGEGGREGGREEEKGKWFDHLNICTHIEHAHQSNTDVVMCNQVNCPACSLLK